MKTENILKLAKAGFTAEQLTTLNDYNVDDIQVLIDGAMTCEDIMKILPALEKVAPAEPPTPQGDNPEGNNPEGNNPPSQPNSTMDLIANELKALRSAIQASNINAAASGGAKQLTLEDVAEGFFNNKGDNNNGK